MNGCAAAAVLVGALTCAPSPSAAQRTIYQGTVEAIDSAAATLDLFQLGRSPRPRVGTYVLRFDRATVGADGLRVDQVVLVVYDQRRDVALRIVSLPEDALSDEPTHREPEPLPDDPPHFTPGKTALRIQAGVVRYVPVESLHEAAAEQHEFALRRASPFLRAQGVPANLEFWNGQRIGGAAGQVGGDAGQACLVQHVRPDGEVVFGPGVSALPALHGNWLPPYGRWETTPAGRRFRNTAYTAAAYTAPPGAVRRIELYDGLWEWNPSHRAFVYVPGPFPPLTGRDFAAMDSTWLAFYRDAVQRANLDQAAALQVAGDVRDAGLRSWDQYSPREQMQIVKSHLPDLLDAMSIDPGQRHDSAAALWRLWSQRQRQRELAGAAGGAEHASVDPAERPSRRQSDQPSRPIGQLPASRRPLSPIAD